MTENYDLHPTLDPQTPPETNVENVRVQLYKRRDGSLFLRVMLLSSKRMLMGQRLWSHGRAEVDGDHNHVLKNVMIVAGALAERQNGMYGDAHDPDDTALRAGQAYEEMRRELGGNI